MAEHLRLTLHVPSALSAAGNAPQQLAYRAPFYPLVPILGFTLCLLACIGLAFDPSQRIALWCGIPFVLFCYAAYYLTQNANTLSTLRRPMMSRNPIAAALTHTDTLILDGALATELERAAVIWPIRCGQPKC